MMNSISVNNKSLWSIMKNTVPCIVNWPLFSLTACQFLSCSTTILFISIKGSFESVIKQQEGMVYDNFISHWEPNLATFCWELLAHSKTFLAWWHPNFFFANFWRVASSQFENHRMVVIISSPLWMRSGSVCKKNMDFPVSAAQKYLQWTVWVEIQRHRKLISASAECDLAETANAPAPSLQANLYVPDTKLEDFFFFTFLCSVHERWVQQAGCSDTLKMFMIPLKPPMYWSQANTVLQTPHC